MQTGYAVWMEQLGSHDREVIMEVLIGLLFVGALVAHATIGVRLTEYRIMRLTDGGPWWAGNMLHVYARENYTAAAERLYFWLKWSALFVALLGLVMSGTAGALTL